MGIGSFIPDLLVSLIAVIFLVYSFINKLWQYYRNKFFYFLIFFWIFLILSAYLSSSAVYAFKPSITYIRFIIFAIAIHYLSLNYPNFYNKTYISFFIALVVSLFFGYFQLITGYSIFFSDLSLLLTSGPIAPYERISGLFGDELVLGGFLLRTLPLYCALFFLKQKKEKNKKDVYYFVTVFILTVLMIFFAGERSALALLVFFLSLCIIFLKTYRSLFLKIFLVVFVLLSVVTIFKKDIRDRYFVHTFKYGFFIHKKINLFSEQHQNHYTAAFKIFLDYPIQGAGIKSFRILCLKNKYHKGMGYHYWDRFINGQFFIVRVPKPCGTHPHNTWVQILAESGIIGMSFFILFYFFLIKQLYKSYLKKENEENDQGKILLILFYFTVFWPIIPTGNFFNNWLSISYFLPLGILISRINSHNLKNLKHE